jgi:hypothetical protein
MASACASQDHEDSVGDKILMLPPAPLFSSSIHIPPALGLDIDDESSDAPWAFMTVCQEIEQRNTPAQQYFVNSSPLALSLSLHDSCAVRALDLALCLSTVLHCSSGGELIQDSSEVRPPKRTKRRSTDRHDNQRNHSWINIDITHSVNEHSVGGFKGYHKEIPSEDDICFTGDFAPMSVSPSHDQAAIPLQKSDDPD